ncbi:MAG: sirohydrochlorin chelatase [Rhodoferax sp.]
MTAPLAPTGIILLAHGSRDPQWKAPIEAVARHIRTLSPDTPVQCAYLELCAPDLPTVAAAMVRDGVRKLRVLPLFLGMGKHAREDLPRLVQALRQAHPHAQVELRASVGEHPALLECLGCIATEDLPSPPPDTTPTTPTAP